MLPRPSQSRQREGGETESSFDVQGLQRAARIYEDGSSSSIWQRRPSPTSESGQIRMEIRGVKGQNLRHLRNQDTQIFRNWQSQRRPVTRISQAGHQRPNHIIAAPRGDPRGEIESSEVNDHRCALPYNAKGEHHSGRGPTAANQKKA